MMCRDQSIVCAGFAALLLAGCAGASDAYPSLAVRDAERAAGGASPASPAPLPAAAVASDEEIGSIARRARQTHQTFLRDQSAALAVVRAASGQGYDTSARARAEVALAGLDSLHGQTAMALAELDALEAASIATLAPTDGIAIAQTQVGSFLSEQAELLDSLQRELAP